MENVILNNGVPMPLLGFGVYQVEDADLCRRSVAEAIRTGYRLFDTASIYRNEQAVGEALRESGMPRADFFLTTKVWISEMGFEQTLRAFDESLNRLGTDYLDLYLLHMPFGDVYGAWRALEKLYREGRVRAIGVCNFTAARLADLLAHFEVVPAVDQVETHLFCQQRALQNYASQHGIRLEAWSPFAEGRRDYFRLGLWRDLADRYGKTPAQVALRWLTQRGIVSIPKSVHAERIRENFEAGGFSLTEAEMAQIAACDERQPLVGDFSDPDFVTRLCAM